VGALRRAREAGITTFDTVGSPDPELAEGLLARAFPEGDPSIVVLAPLGPGPTGTPAGIPAASLSLAPGFRPPFLARDGPPTQARFRRLLEAELPGAAGPALGSTDPVAEPTVVRCHSIEDVTAASRRPVPRLLSGPCSLLDPSVALAAEQQLGPSGFAWIARDPFAGGRLDGSRFARASLSARSGSPATLRELETEFAPVARFAFLALPRRRTLAQAALHFVADRPWVGTTVLPMPPPERWEEFVGFRSAPPLDDGERARVAALIGPSVASSGHPENRP